LDYNTNLEKVSFSFNELAQLPNELFRNLSKLKILDLSRNNLTELPVHSAPLMYHLNLSRNSFSQLPDEIFQYFPKLSLLDLSENKFENVSVNLFRNNPDLETLIWENDTCYLTSGSRHFPRHLFFKNKNLKTFSFSTKVKNGTFSCQNVTFSENIFENQNLQNLRISNTQLDGTDIGENAYQSL
jgi:Leucine-rich repeat (LRR) protein